MCMQKFVLYCRFLSKHDPSLCNEFFYNDQALFAWFTSTLLMSFELTESSLTEINAEKAEYLMEEESSTG